MDILEAAKESVKAPDSYFSAEGEEFEFWGRIGVSKNRDSKPLGLAIFDSILEELTVEFGDENVETVYSSHWGHGWCEEIKVRVFKEGSDPENRREEDITDVFTYFFENIMDADIVRYEDKISEYEYNELVDSIIRDCNSNGMIELPGACYGEEERENAKKIASVAFDACWDTEHGLSGDELLMACWELGFVDHDELYAEDWEEWLLDHQGYLDELGEILSWFRQVAEIESGQTVLPL